MPKKINIPFTNEMSAGNKKSFKLLNDKQLNINYKISTISLLNVLEHLVEKKKNSLNIDKLFFEKGSKSKSYYTKLKKNKK